MTMIRRLGISLALLLLSTVACAQSLKIPDAIFIASTALDASSTYRNLSSGRYSEANAAMSSLSPAGVTIMTAGLSAFSLWCAHRLKAEGHPKGAWAILLIGGGLHTFAGVHNVSVWEPR